MSPKRRGGKGAGAETVPVSLRESEARLRSVFRAVPAGIGVTSECVIRAANERLAEMLGYPIEELVGRTTRMFYPSDEEYERVGAALYAEGAAGRPNEVETRWIRKDGRAVDVLVAAAPIHGGDLPDGFTFAALDVTEHRRSEQAIRAIVEGTSRATGRAFFRELVRQLAGALGFRIAFLAELVPGDPRRARTLAVWAGNQLVDDFEYEIEGSPCQEILNRGLTCFASGVQVQFPKDALLVRMEVESYVGVPLRDSAGQLLGVLSLMDDRKIGRSDLATSLLAVFSTRAAAELERDRAVQARERSQERLSLALEATADALWDWDVPTGRAYFSPHYYEMLGYAPDDFPASYGSWRDLCHPDDIGRVEEHLSRYLRGEEPSYEAEFRARTRTGEWKWMLARGKVVSRDAAGRPLRVVGTHTDFTDRKRAEQERATLEVQLRHAQKMEAVGQLAGGVAHDFNNLLQAIQGYADIALAGLPEGHPARRHLSEVVRAANRAADLTRQLLAFSRRETFQPRLIDLNDVIAGLTKLLRRVIGERVELTVRPGAGLDAISGDPGQVEQVLMNLCLNARDAMPRGGSLVIETGREAFDEAFCRHNPWARPGRFVFLGVSDTGEGIAPEIQERIFEPFFTTKEVGQGTGLGLAIVYGIVERHGGFIRVRSELGRGAAFRVWFPAASTKALEEGAGAADGDVRGGSETILLAEDDEMVRDFTAEVLRRAGYEVRVVADGAGALDVIAREGARVDLAILDVVMPGKSGREVQEGIAAAGLDVPVLFTSGYPRGAVDASRHPDASTRLLPKPYPPKDLLRAVREMLDARRGSKEA